MTLKKFSQMDGYEISDLLDYANDHLKASKYLFAGDPEYFDSAGYLAHMGLELFLKAWHLYEHGFFTNSHSLHSIYEGIKAKNKNITLSPAQLGTLGLVDRFNALRYPSILEPIDIGNEDWDKILELVADLSRKMPRECFEEYQGSKVMKGGRVLAERPRKKPRKTSTT